jgi:hypothetical protein
MESQDNLISKEFLLELNRLVRERAPTRIAR